MGGNQTRVFPVVNHCNIGGITSGIPVEDHWYTSGNQTYLHDSTVNNHIQTSSSLILVPTRSIIYYSMIYKSTRSCKLI